MAAKAWTTRLGRSAPNLLLEETSISRMRIHYSKRDSTRLGCRCGVGSVHHRAAANLRLSTMGTPAAAACTTDGYMVTMGACRGQR